MFHSAAFSSGTRNPALYMYSYHRAVALTMIMQPEGRQVKLVEVKEDRHHRSDIEALTIVSRRNLVLDIDLSGS